MEKGKESVRKNQIAGMYDLCETIGEGHYAMVKLAKHVFTGEMVAVKVIDKMKLDAATQMQMLQEVRLMKLVQHPFVVRLYDVIDTQTKLYLVLEFADGGDMYDYIMRHEGGLKEETARKYFRQIVTAIQYCHKLHVVHRDLKPENVVFFEKQGLVKLTDFGFSNKFSPGQRLRTSCGSLAYSAPEILLGDAYDAPAVDIWSLGVILYMLVCGAAPFQEANDSETLTMIMDCKYTFPTHISQDCKSLISRMLQRQPELRASLDDIIRDPWLNDTASQTIEPNKPPSWLEDMIPEEAFYPLAAREHLTEEEHANILQRMVHGAIARKEEIIDSLDRNEYNHITATYFLLAERKLRSHKQASIQKANLASGSKITLDDNLTRKRSGSNPSSPVKDQPSESSSCILDSMVESLSPRRVQRRSQTTMVDSLVSPQESPTRITQPSLVPSSTSVSSTFSSTPSGVRFRQCSIVEEEDEDSDEKSKPYKTSRHSSTSSLAEKSAALVEVASNLDLRLSAEKSETPAPFPLTSQIGTGGLSRQGSLRKSGGETPSGSSPTSDRKSIPGSPTTPTGSSATSSTHGSPARFKISLPNRKLASTRSSPQLVTAAPVLNQIHEEAEEGGGSPAPSLTKEHVDLVDQFPSTAAGAVVTKRLELRRRLRLLKARTASCSSSEASDDDSETRRNREREQDLTDHTPSPPPRSTHRGRDRQNDDSSDSQDPGLAGTGGNSTSNQSVSASNQQIANQNSSSGPGSSSGGGGNSSGHGGNVKHHSTHRHRHHMRVRQSHSLNRISELHAEDFLLGCDSDERNSKPAININLQRQPSSESDSDTCDMLSRYLESLSANHRSNRSRDDSLNSSDGEFEGIQGHEQPRPPRRHKINLLSLEQRLNKIQEECNKSGSEEDEGDEGDISDNVSTTVPEPQDDLSEYRANSFILELNNVANGNSCNNVSNGNTFTKPTVQRLHINKRSFNYGDRDETTSVKSCDVAPLRNNKERKHVLHRAHSCGSLLSLKERALLRRKLSNAHYGVAATFWDLIKTSEESAKTNKNGLQNELTLALTAASNPLTVFNLQGTSRCCNLC